MAELNVAAGAGRHKGIARSKKLSTRVDLTPMVDLGFLLITFFVFTTALSKPVVLPLALPADSPVDMNIAESTALTLVPMGGGKCFYYQGDLQNNNYGITTSIRDVITRQQQALDKSGKFTRADLMLIIKPTNDASYKDIVDVLDEMVINDVKHYALVDITKEELEFVQRHPN